jgi:hypothetical protein
VHRFQMCKSTGLESAKEVSDLKRTLFTSTWSIYLDRVYVPYGLLRVFAEKNFYILGDKLKG